jgi:hypothetical protein
MILEHRFVLADFVHVDDAGHRHVYEAGRSYPMRPAVAHAAAKRDLVAHHKPPNWTAPSILTPPQLLSGDEVAAAAAELEALDRHGVEAVRPAG